MGRGKQQWRAKQLNRLLSTSALQHFSTVNSVAAQLTAQHFSTVDSVAAQLTAQHFSTVDSVAAQLTAQHCTPQQHHRHTASCLPLLQPLAVQMWKRILQLWIRFQRTVLRSKGGREISSKWQFDWCHLVVSDGVLSHVNFHREKCVRLWLWEWSYTDHVGSQHSLQPDDVTFGVCLSVSFPQLLCTNTPTHTIHCLRTNWTLLLCQCLTATNCI